MTGLVRPDRAVVAMARGRHGVLTVAQLVDAGLSHDAVLHRVEQGWLRRLHRGVYLVGALETPFSRALGAVLAYGDGALLSHHPAAVLCGFGPPPADPLHVTAPRDIRSRDRIIAHATRHLDPRDATSRHGIPVTSPARTILDLAATSEAEAALNEALLQRQVSLPSLNEQFRRYPRHRGTPALRKAIEAEPALTRSEAERRTLDLIHKARVVEVDGFAFHSVRASFERDRRRDQRLIAAGWKVLRVTWRQLEHEPEAVVATLAAVLSPRA